MEGSMRENRIWAWHGIEPRVDEMLADPIVLALMRSDGVTSDDARALMRGVTIMATPREGCCCGA
jgi:hypothetical protein